MFVCRRVRSLLALFLPLISLTAFAAPRVSTLAGGEVEVRRGAAPVLRSEARERKVTGHATVNVSAGADTSAAVNDYRRIQDAINAAGNGDTIILSGTFDFTQPFAAASWALGNDNITSTGDDYSVFIPANLNGVTLTAASLGSAIIVGPGDVAALDLESFLYFDGSGDYQNWTLSNLEIREFDLAIGMFSGAGGSDAYNGTTITNNRIRLARDLNATVAPADLLQNIAIHYSFGINQTISNNVIELYGDGVSDGSNLSVEVGMQSNTSGGVIYDGLSISNNVIEVLNAQSANPERLLGIWENAQGHLSDITVENNTFTNLAAGNDPALNLQAGFRVTSHSGAATTVEYRGNEVVGARVGIAWITGQNFSGNQAVVVRENAITDCHRGIEIRSQGIAHLIQNEITGSGTDGGVRVIDGSLTGSGAQTAGAYRNIISGSAGDAIHIEATAGTIAPIVENDLRNTAGIALNNFDPATINAERNWWGSNLQAAVTAEQSGAVDGDPWLASGTDLQPLTMGFQPFLYATTSGALTTFAGTAGADIASVSAGDPIALTIGSETGNVVAAQLLNLAITLSDGDDLLTLAATGVPTTVDLGGDMDELQGPNSAITYNVNANNAGTAAGLATSFTSVESITGGTAGDTFLFTGTGLLSGTIDGNLGVDTLNTSGLAAVVLNGPGTLDGYQGNSGVLGAPFDNINAFAGNPADLVVTKSGPATATAGTMVTYTITLTNNGPFNAMDVNLTDVLPPGTTFASIAPAGSLTCTTPAPGANGTVTCSGLQMPPGTMTITLMVNTPSTPGPLSNTASVTSVNEGAAGNESSTANTTLEAPVMFADLAVTKVASGSSVQGSTVTYTITVTNNGPDAATNVTLTDILPAGVAFDSVNTTQGSCSGTTTVTCSLGTLANAASATVTLNVIVTASSGAIVNTATASSDATDPTPANDSGSATINAAAQAAAVPSLSFWALVALATLLGAVAVVRVR